MPSSLSSWCKHSSRSNWRSGVSLSVEPRWTLTRTCPNSSQASSSPTPTGWSRKTRTSRKTMASKSSVQKFQESLMRLTPPRKPSRVFLTTLFLPTPCTQETSTTSAVMLRTEKPWLRMMMITRRTTASKVISFHWSLTWPSSPRDSWNTSSSRLDSQQTSRKLLSKNE